MTALIVVLATLFSVGLLLGLVARWPIVCLVEAALLIAAFVVALLRHAPLTATFATLVAGFFIMQVAYLCSGLLLEGWRLFRQTYRGQPADKLNS